VIDTTNKHRKKLLIIALKYKNVSLTGETITIVEKNCTTKIDVLTISNVRIIKNRMLFINYILAILLVIIYHFLNKILSNNVFLHHVLILLVFLAIFASFSVKMYSYSVLINSNDLIFRKFNIVTNENFISLKRYNETSLL
jgi:hypothetical protein